MKVAHINAGNEYGGGLVHIVSLLSALKTKGLTTELILMEEGPVAVAAREKGVAVKVVGQSNRYDLRIMKKLQNYINENQFDVIHTHGPRANMLVNLLRPFLKTKWVVTIHSNPLLDFEDRGLKGRLFEKVNTRSLINADGVIAVSGEIKSIALELGVQQNCVATIHNGIDFSDPVAANHRKHVFTLISIGRLHAIKNFNFLLESLADARLTNWQLILCGEGEEEASLRLKAQELDCVSKLDFKGWVSAAELGTVISQADVMVHPSKSESFPLVLLEAAEQEVPVIATDVGDVKELVSDPSVGWLIESANKKQMVTALEEAYKEWTDESLKFKGKSLRKKALHFTLSAQADKVITFYNKIL